MPAFPHHEVSHGVHPPPLMAVITGSRVLTREGAKKKTLELELIVRNHVINYSYPNTYVITCGSQSALINEWLNYLCTEF